MYRLLNLLMLITIIIVYTAIGGLILLGLTYLYNCGIGYFVVILLISCVLGVVSYKYE